MERDQGQRVAVVDLTTDAISEEWIEDATARDYVGGYGLGVRFLYERQPKGADPLGPEAILGFATGPMTSARVPGTGRYMAVGKSPLTGGWGDANSGGYFGTELKRAGWDALFVTGAAETAKSIIIDNQGIRIAGAEHLWGLDTIETEMQIKSDLESEKYRVASIGPASERLSFITGIVNDGGRIAARSGLGAVMGAKKLKAIAVLGKADPTFSDPKRLSELRNAYNKQLVQNGPAMANTLRQFGTAGSVEPLLVQGATPIKNWLLSGKQAFPGVEKLSGPNVVKFQSKRYGCSGCSVACGGIISAPEQTYPIDEMHKPEYETIAAFGPMCLNDDLDVILKLNDMCNRSGLDTISAGTAIAFAIECFEKGILNLNDTDGIELTWGNSPAMVELLQKMILREGLGDVLADGTRLAAERIGQGTEEFAIHVGGQEPGMHFPLLLPGRATGYASDPTPGRHTQTPMARVDVKANIGPYSELQFPGFEQSDYQSRGPAGAMATCYWQTAACAGFCMFPVLFFGDYPMMEFVNAVTGWEWSISDVLDTGARIHALRQQFNIREGIKPSEITLPGRMTGSPPKTEGPHAGLTIDGETLVREHYRALGWDPSTGAPRPDTIKRLGLSRLVEEYG